MTLVSERQQQTISIATREGVADPHAEELIRQIQKYYSPDLVSLKIEKHYHIKRPLDLEEIAETAFIDPVQETLVTESTDDYDWKVEVRLKPGVTDNSGRTAQITIEDFLGETPTQKEWVTTSTTYLFKGHLSRHEMEEISEGLLLNALIQDYILTQGHEEIDLNVDDHELMAISKQRQLALSLEEMQTIRDHFQTRSPTELELEVLAQTWSEHCKHKIFNAEIEYCEGEHSETINSLFNTYIKGATKPSDWLVSLFTDNAGIIRLNHEWNLAFKVETHNSPSALDPYGGALTGILGVNRDILGAGRGARLIANTDVFCFAEPNYEGKIPVKLLHPKRIFEGVRKGVEDGGNKSGIPTINGSVYFDKSYLGKPLVYCGSLGLIPHTIEDEETHIKEIKSGDYIVIAGGRTGRDGIHGATFSSEELHTESPLSAVQIGDPFTQKKLQDFLLAARDGLLFRTLTDNGAGGFSSSVGELAELSGGCEVHLDRALLKQDDLKPWEIFVSESQERMTFAVPPENWEEFCYLAQWYEVEVCQIGTFTDTGRLHVLYDGKTMGNLDLDFLHHGLPKMRLKAVWEKPPQTQHTTDVDVKATLHRLLKSYNICSKEWVVRQYDHEVQGATVLKPLVGESYDGPGNASVIRPVEVADTSLGITLSHGMCPRYSTIDAYHMATCAVDEAVRNAVAVGTDPNRIAILDNFCWPDPIYDPVKTPDGHYKLAQLVRANRGLYDAATAYGLPIISGKDSMKNDYKSDEMVISILPTLLISAVGIVPDIQHTMSMDFKEAGDLVYLLGTTRAELGATSFSDTGAVPTVDFVEAKQTFDALHQAMPLIRSCHDCSDGGLGVALAESAFSGNLGADITLEKIPLDPVEALFSETPSRFVVSVPPENQNEFEALFASLTPLGKVTNKKLLRIDGIMEEEITSLKASWQETLGGGLYA